METPKYPALNWIAVFFRILAWFTRILTVFLIYVGIFRQCFLTSLLAEVFRIPWRSSGGSNRISSRRFHLPRNQVHHCHITAGHCRRPAGAYGN